MTRIVCYSVIVLMFLSISTFSMDLSDIYNYVHLITDVHKYYQTTCIVIVRSDNYTDFNGTTLMHVLSRAFSSRGIQSAIVSFPELSYETRKYQGYVSRPLYVVLLATKETMDEFAMATRQIDTISFPVWFVMFLPYQGNPSTSICQGPTGNPFNLDLNTEMLVLCYDLPILSEWYSLHDNHTKIFHLAKWIPGERLWLMTNKTLYARRSNMQGEVLRIAFLKGSLFVSTENGTFTKFFGEVIEELRKSMNFTINATDAIATYGSWNEEEHAWTGVIGAVASKKVDIGVAEFSMTPRRMDAVDFTSPLVLSRNKVYFRMPDGDSVQWSAYFKAFNMEIWTMIVCIIISAPILLTVMKTGRCTAMKVLTDNYVHVWGIYCQQGLSEFPDESPLRLALLSMFMSALIISSAYSASLISFLTVSTVSLPFSTLEGFAARGSHKLITFKKSSDYDLIMSGKGDLLMRLKKLLKREEDLPVAAVDAFEQVCSENVGFFVTEVIKNTMDNIPCRTVYVEADGVDTLAMVLRKGSPYKGVINYHLQKFKDNGMLNRIKSMYLASKPYHYKDKYISVTLVGVAPILSVLAGGIVLGCFILILEKLYFIFRESKYEENAKCVRKLKYDGVGRRKRRI